jgi:hypothetical protein
MQGQENARPALWILMDGAMAMRDTAGAAHRLHNA